MPVLLIFFLSVSYGSSEIHINADLSCDIEVDEERVRLEGTDERAWTVDAGASPVRVFYEDVVSWDGFLELPDEVDAWLKCDGQSVILERVAIRDAKEEGQHTAEQSDSDGAKELESAMLLALPDGREVTLRQATGESTPKSGDTADSAALMGDPGTSVPKNKDKPKRLPASVRLVPPPEMSRDGVTVAISAPMATEQELKLAVKMTSDEGAFVVLERSASTLRSSLGTANARLGRATIAPPGGTRGASLVFVGDHRGSTSQFSLLGLSRIPLDGVVIPGEDFDLSIAERVSIGPASCTLTRKKQTKKATKASFDCTTSDAVVIVPAAIGTLLNGGYVANRIESDAALLVPGAMTRVDVQLPAGATSLSWGKAFRVAEFVPVVFDEVELDRKLKAR